MGVGGAKTRHTSRVKPVAQIVMGFPKNPSHLDKQNENPSHFQHDFLQASVTGSLESMEIVMGFWENPSHFWVGATLQDCNGSRVISTCKKPWVCKLPNHGVS